MAKLVPQEHPTLHQIAEEVPLAEIPTPKIQKVLKDMRAALHTYEADGFTGVAIAAPQVGVPLRIFLVEDMSKRKDDEPRLPALVAINPRIVKLSKKKAVIGEGCLSVPDGYGNVERAERATIRAYDAEGKEYEHGGSGLLAQIFQHEVDHLDGILFVDRAVKLFDKSELAEKRASHEES